MSITKVSPISGFPEFLPEEQIVFNKVVQVIREGFERAGAIPIETSAVERINVLLSKSSDDKEIYALTRIHASEGDDNDLALHFDLTVPLARYVVQNSHKLIFPFKRYQIQPVWRGERAQAGRYRQFYQCDIDVVGDGELSLLNDSEMPYVIYQVFSLMNIGHFKIKVNNRKILEGFLNHNGISGNAISSVFKIIDSLEKVGLSKVKNELSETGLDATTVNTIVDFFTKSELTDDEIIKYLESTDMGDMYNTGVSELKTVVNGVKALGVPTDYFGIDLSIARGLNYYTGTIYETILTEHPGIGSICSGGRYDELASYFSNKKYPGVGLSIGLTRLFPKLMQLGILKKHAQTVSPVLVTVLDQERILDYLNIGRKLRNAGINTEVYLEKKKISVQMKYASKKGYQYVIICGENEFNSNTLIIKDMSTGEQFSICEDELVEKMLSII